MNSLSKLSPDRLHPELRNYENNVISPLATQQICIDLDDGAR
jgi:hypothetical protein